MKRAIISTLLAFASALPLAAHAQADNYPSRPIKMIVPFAPGGGSDNAARFVGQEITRMTSQPVIIENRPGVGGNLGAQLVADAKPDGYTVLQTANGHVTNEFVIKATTLRPFRDFKAVAMFKKTAPLVVIVGVNSPYKTLSDLTAAARAKPGQLTYGSGNATSRIAAEYYRSLTGTNIIHVPFRGVPPALIEVAAGRVDFIFSDAGAFVPMLAAGKVRALAVTGTERLVEVPDVPTSAEAGLAKLVLGSWSVFLVPAATPDVVADRLHDLVQAAMRSEGAAHHYKANNSEPFFTKSRAEVDRFLREEQKSWREIIKAAGIEPE